MVAIAIEVRKIFQTVARCISLKLRHSVRHDLHATLQGISLNGTKSAGDTHDPGGVDDQIALASEHRGGQEGVKLAREALCRLVTCDNPGEAFRERLLLRRGQRRLVFDGVCDSTQEVGVAHHVAKRSGELRNGKGEGAGHALQNVGLVGEIVARLRL